MDYHDKAGVQASELTENFILAINGAFFRTRKVGTRTTPTDINVGRRSLFVASHLYAEGMLELMSVCGKSLDAQIAMENVNSVSTQLLSKGSKAITTGIGNGAARYLGNGAHGAMGELVGQKAQTLDLSVRDSAGRTWKDPSKLVQVIVRDFCYQQEVDQRIRQLIVNGCNQFSIADHSDPYEIADLPKLRPYLFHVNSTKLPRAIHV